MVLEFSFHREQLGHEPGVDIYNFQRSFFLLQLLRRPGVIHGFRRINHLDVEPKEDTIHSSTTEVSAFS